MKTVNFEFRGIASSLVIPSGYLSELCAADIISGKSYPFPESIGSVQPKCVVDIGGHAGEFSVMARIIWPQAVIHCFEPNPELKPFLAANAAKHGFIVHGCGVGAVDIGQAELRVSGYGSVANSFVSRPNQTGAALMTSIMSVSRLPQPIDVLKVDAEGYEMPILNGLDELGRLKRIELIYVEFHQRGDRLAIDDLLLPSHDLFHAHIGHPDQGELMYVRRS